VARRHGQTGKRDGSQLQPAAPPLLAEQPPLEATPTDAPDRVVDVDDEELDRFTKLGWRFVSIVNARKLWYAGNGRATQSTP